MTNPISDALAKHPDVFKLPETLGTKKVEAVAQKRGFQAQDLLGLIDTSLMGSGAEGVYFTTTALHWAVDEAYIDEKKKTRGTLPYRELLHAFTEVQTGPLSNTLVLKKVDGARTWTEIKIKFSGGVHASDPLLEVVNLIIEYAKSLPEEAGETLTADAEYEAQAVEYFISNSTPKAVASYRAAFAAYQKGETPSYAWAWNWGAAIFGPLYLVFYKLYEQAVAIGAAALIIGYFFPFIGLMVWVSVGTLGPFWFFQKFLRDKASAEASITETEARLQKINELGRPHPLLAKTAGAMGIVLGAVIVIGGIWLYFNIFF